VPGWGRCNRLACCGARAERGECALPPTYLEECDLPEALSLESVRGRTVPRRGGGDLTVGDGTLLITNHDAVHVVRIPAPC
jgi:hypothetical protein